MRGYGETKEISIGSTRFFLISVPGGSGYWMLCTPVVQVACPTCGSSAGEPCTADRGHVVLTKAQTNATEVLVNGGKIRQSMRRDFRQKLKTIKYYRNEPHPERKQCWREMGLNNPGGESDTHKTLRMKLKETRVREKKVAGQLREALTLIRCMQDSTGKFFTRHEELGT